MRGHKFLCLIDHNYFHEGVFTDEITAQIDWNEDSYMKVLTVAHEKFEDNLVTLKNEDDFEDEYTYVRTVDGKLYCVADWWDKNEVIRKFEQTDEEEA